MSGNTNKEEDLEPPEWWDSCQPGDLLEVVREYHSCDGKCFTRDQWGNSEECRESYLKEKTILLVIDKFVDPAISSLRNFSIFIVKSLGVKKIHFIEVSKGDFGVRWISRKVNNARNPVIPGTPPTP